MEQTILNLTQHVATPEQIEAGVFEPSAEDKKEIQKLLTFEEIKETDPWSRFQRAEKIAKIAIKYFPESYNPEEDDRGRAMIGGAPYFMSKLERVLSEFDISPMYAFSKRESVDQPQPDGSVRKVQVFRHAGFVEV